MRLASKCEFEEGKKRNYKGGKGKMLEHYML